MNQQPTLRRVQRRHYAVEYFLRSRRRGILPSKNFLRRVLRRGKRRPHDVEDTKKIGGQAPLWRDSSVTYCAVGMWTSSSRISEKDKIVSDLNRSPWRNDFIMIFGRKIRTQLLGTARTKTATRSSLSKLLSDSLHSNSLHVVEKYEQNSYNFLQFSPLYFPISPIYR